MAELLLKVGAGANYEDGDIICAFNDRSIQCGHAEHICHPWRATPNADGLLDLGTVVEDLYRRTHEFRFERVSRTEYRKTTIATGESYIIGPTMNARGECVDLPLKMRWARAHRAPNGAPKMALFGTEGAEVWYGGSIDVSQAKVDLVWTDIEAKTAHRKSAGNCPVCNHRMIDFALGTEDLKVRLAVPVDDFDDATQSKMESPLTTQIGLTEDGDPILRTVKRRKYHVNWRLLTPIELPPFTSQADVEDRSKSVDVRKRSAGAYNRTLIVQGKVL